MDAGNMLKPMLARGELRMVGATTLDEYREHIEKDPALERRFQQVFVGEPSVEDTIAILRGLKERYEAHHEVRIADAALVAAATLSDRYITGPLPARQGDRPGRRGRCPAAHGDRLRAGRDRRAPARRRAGWRWRSWRWPRRPTRRRMRAAGAAARGPRRPPRGAGRADRPLGAGEGAHRPDRRLKEQLETAARARPSGPSATATWPGAAELRYGRHPRAGAARWPTAEAIGRRAGDSMVKEEVGPDDIAEVVSAWTGIPAGRLLEGETAKLLRMEDELGRAPGRPARGRRGRSPTRSAGPAPASPTPTGRPARSCSSARPASARPSWPRRWRTSCSTTSARWSAST